MLALSCRYCCFSNKCCNRKKNIPLIFLGEPSTEYSSYYNYDQFEELNVEKFNKTTNLGINAEDMLEMINENIQMQI